MDPGIWYKCIFNDKHECPREYIELGDLSKEYRKCGQCANYISEISNSSKLDMEKKILVDENTEKIAKKIKSLNKSIDAYQSKIRNLSEKL